MKNTKKAFSLIEVLFAIVLLSMIALFLIPSASFNLNNAKTIKDRADTTFILEEAIETSRNKPIGKYSEKIGRKDITIEITSYSNIAYKGKYKKIVASFGNQSFEPIEACDEKGI